MRGVLVVGITILLVARAGVDAAAQNVAAAMEASDVNGEELPALQRPARLQAAGVSLTEALAELSERSGVVVAYSPSRLAAEGPVDCDCADLTVAEALEHLLASTGYRFSEVEGYIVIIPRRASRPTPHRDRLSAPTAVYASRNPEGVTLRPQGLLQIASVDGPLQGLVVDARTRQPIVGAQVVVAGTQIGTLTNTAGRFRLADVPGTEVILEVVRIGYRTIRQPARVGDLNIQIQLTQTAVELDEIVVTGAPGGVERRALGNVVGTINATEVTGVAQISSVQDLLNARIPGVVVLNGDGQVGSGPRITIRGLSSLNLSTEPLIYIDGVRASNAVERGPFGGSTKFVNRLNDINPNDIDRIEVIKGPAAATLYGTEASNGVINIITKRGVPGTRSVGVRLRQGAAWIHDLERRWPVNYGRDPETGQIVSANYAQLERERGTPFFRTGRLQGLGLNLSGGTPEFQYYTGIDYDDNEGVDRDNRARRVSARGNFNLAPHQAVTIATNFGVSLSGANFSHFLALPTYSGVSANPALLSTPSRGFPIGPPDAVRQGLTMREDVNRFTGGVEVRHRATEWLSHRLAVGLDFTDDEASWLVPNLEGNPAASFISFWRDGLRYIERWGDTYNTVDYSATASSTLGPFVSSNTAAGFQLNSKRTNYNRSVTRNFPVPGLESLASGAVKDIQEQTVIENTTIGLYLQQQLGWQDRLFLTGAVRADDNSAFGEQFELVMYPKFSASWIASEEPFFDGMPFLNTLKLRAAIGASGRQPDAFTALRTYQAVTGTGGLPTVTPLDPGNPMLKPERGEEVEVGFDAALLDDRLAIDFTWYRQRVRDAILVVGGAPSFGFPGQQVINAGELQNKGFEVLVTGLILDSRDVKWEMSLNLATNDNRVLSLGGDTDFISIFPTTGHKVGYPVQGWFIRRVVSADLDADGRAVNILCDGGEGPPVACSEAPRVFWGRGTPRVEGAVRANATLFDRLRVHALVDFHTGHKRSSSILSRCLGAAGVCEENFYPERFDPVRVAEVQLGLFDVAGTGIVDASFAKLREVSASLSLPDEWARSFRASRASVTVAARNLHTWTKFPGLDPEVFDQQGFGRANPAAYGASWQVPAPRQLVTTIDLIF